MPLIRKPPEGMQAGPRQRPDLEAALQHGAPDDRWAAARAIADAPQGLRALSTALASESDPRVREVIFTGLVRIGTPDSARAVLPYLRSEDAGTRRQALDALRAMPEAAKPHLGTVLKDQDADVRLLACEIVRDAPDAMALLCTLLETETESNVCA